MANISAIKKLKYTPDASANWSNGLDLTVLWDSPFYDTNYVISVQVEVAPASSAMATNYAIASIYNVTSKGFSVNLFVNPVAGDVLTLHCMASHK